MSLRLVTAMIVASFFLIAGVALGQPLDAVRGITEPPQSQETERDRTRERERTVTDPSPATGSFGSTNRGSASGAADSPPAERARNPGGDTMAEPTGPGSAEHRPGTAVTQ
jgi:hypothetical protein